MACININNITNKNISENPSVILKSQVSCEFRLNINSEPNKIVLQAIITPECKTKVMSSETCVKYSNSSVDSIKKKRKQILADHTLPIKIKKRRIISED